MITVKNLHKSFDDLEVLKGITHTFEKGKTTVILGASGSGKSTLLRCMNHLNNDFKGEILVDGVNTKELSHSQLVSKVGMVFQSFNLFHNMSVIKNVTYALQKVKKIEKIQAEHLAINALNKVGIGDKLYNYPSHLSGGQKQRVALARALVLQPNVMLFDEPTSALDPETVNEVLDEIKKLTYTGLTNIIVTHEIGFAKEVADQVIFMDDGKIVEVNDSKSFFNNPKQERTKQFLNKVL